MQHKKVTVIHHREQLINDTWPEKFRKDVERRWGLRGVTFILGDKLDVPPEGTVGVTTHKGRHIPDADLVVSTVLAFACGDTHRAVTDPGLWIAP